MYKPNCNVRNYFFILFLTFGCFGSVLTVLFTFSSNKFGFIGREKKMPPQSIQNSFSLSDRFSVVDLDPTMEEIERILFAPDESSDSDDSRDSSDSDSDRSIVWGDFFELFCGDCGALLASGLPCELYMDVPEGRFFVGYGLAHLNMDRLHVSRLLWALHLYCCDEEKVIIQISSCMSAFRAFVEHINIGYYRHRLN